jgi:hypothetical protein
MNERAITEWIKDNVAYVVPIGDIHIGDRAFTKNSASKLNGYIDWINTHRNARCILMGDIFNVATRTSKTSPFQAMSLKDEMKTAINMFRPIKNKILGVIDGNHESRAEDYMDYSPMLHFCDVLKLRYLQYSGVFKIGVGLNDRKVSPGPTSRHNYIIYAHHTTGGGTTKGGRLNRVAKLSDIVVNADIYLGAHNHDLITSPNESFMVDRRSGTVSRFRQFFVDCGGYLDWNNSYAERKMFPPLKIGSPRIRLDGGHNKDVKVSL